MALKKITEQQFLSRRKDRRMVFVDAVAALVGLLLLTASVGGVVVLESEPQPGEWSVSMFEGRISEKRCAGGDAGRVGCSFVVGPDGQSVKSTKTGPKWGANEGDEIAVGFSSVAAPNVTRATMVLTWIDNIPDTSPGSTTDDAKKGNRYRYDENATDILMLRVLTPWGEERQAVGENSMPTSDQLPQGEIRFEFNISEMPAPSKQMGFTQDEVQKQLAAQYTDNEHMALGAWGAWVTVLRAGDINGTAPANACHGYTPTGDSYDVPSEFEDAFDGSGQDPCDVDTTTERQLEGKAPAQDVGPAEGYYSTDVDPGNEWVLDFTLWTYSTTVAL